MDNHAGPGAPSIPTVGDVTHADRKVQVMMCFAQGLVYTLLLCGWRHWNREAKFSGKSVGARLRRWWWGVNNWKIPMEKKGLRDTKLAKNVKEVSALFLNVWRPGVR